MRGHATRQTHNEPTTAATSGLSPQIPFFCVHRPCIPFFFYPQVELAGGQGVKIATILEDPVVNPGEMHIYTTHTKHFPVRGTGFLSVLDPSRPPSIVIDGLSALNYKIQVRCGGID